MIATTKASDCLLPNNCTSVDAGVRYEDKIGLITMMVLLSTILLCMIILLTLPKSIQDSIFNFVLQQHPEQSFSYIDVGLYKTRHTMYRKEVFSQMMCGRSSKHQPSMHLSEDLKEMFGVTSAAKKAVHNNLLLHNSITKMGGRPFMNDSNETRSKHPELVVTMVENDFRSGRNSAPLMDDRDCKVGPVRRHSFSGAIDTDDASGSCHYSRSIQPKRTGSLKQVEMCQLNVDSNLSSDIV